MNEQPTTNQATLTEQEEGIKIQDIIALCLKNWYWILISVTFFLGYGIYYLLKTEPTYTRSATVVIKEQSRTKQALGSDMSSFADMGLFASKENVYNELLSIQSPDIVMEVVKRLEMNMNYSVKKGLRNNTLYGRNLPIRAKILEIGDNESCSFNFCEEKDGSISLSKFHNKELESDAVVKGHYGDTLGTPIGKVVVNRSLGYTFTQSNPDEKKKPEVIQIRRSGLSQTCSACSKKLSVSLSDKNATAIDLVYPDHSTSRGDDFLNTLISVYNERWVEDRNQIAVATSLFIGERLGVIEQELGIVDSDISNYKSQNLIPDVKAASNLYMSQATAAGDQILALNNQLYMARYIKNFIQSSTSNNQLLPANSGINAPSIEQQINTYNTQLLQRNNLVANSSEQNPLVLDIDKNLSAVKEAILVSIDNQINALNAQIDGYKESEQKSTSRIASNPTQAKYLLSIERQQKVKESLYLFLLQKREENELSQAFIAYNTRIIKYPTGSTQPSEPSKMKTLFIFLVLGFGLPIGIIILMEMFNTKVRGKKDLERLSVPFVGEIPQIGKSTSAWKLLSKKYRKSDKQGIRILVQSKKRNIINEAFRVVRTNFEFFTGLDSNNKVMMVTSCNPHSGKSFISLNLGAAFSIKGKKTILLDMDLRRASLSSVVDKPSNGISSILSGKISNWKEVVLPVEDAENLDIIPVGTLPPNPSELLYSPRLGELLAQLRQIYDLIIIDCPPVEIVADTSIISKHADITTFVVRAGLLDRDMLPQVQKYYDEGYFNNMAILLNCSKAGGRYGYHYGYRYGYNYGYGNEYTTEE